MGDLLSGSFVGLIVMIGVGATFMTAEYRRGVIRTTLTASPRRGRLLAAKAAVLGSVTFGAALIGAVLAVPLGLGLARSHEVYVFPMSAFTELRVIVGTAALSPAPPSWRSPSALASHDRCRRHRGCRAHRPVLPAGANPFLPASFGNWAMRLTPAASFSVQQTLIIYHQVASNYGPYNGYFPLPWWGGLAVLCGYVALALGLAAAALARRDA